ncbi:Putative uncharacterized protein [Mycoavidus cysteinexigens]|uniref:Uncharacterized protein n=1 Tax=Mycoavidus cysteinexigens TaxID=1553431 RepID=A0A2Z6EX09_9BURK|nr:NACHT domain-containing protein [Mycoavidus cysteinexigens]BBE09987.1 Putative uncharacterized protein [Mycoavidus cysteinexigens]GAM53669.1 hypothetical protein EBME_2132 [bacterium endosymbiont of Mortierella elongata FMR23-6]GLR02275.1 hypothetical protein GCM10007934_20910 [Mycoavidus cysteinexigens]
MLPISSTPSTPASLASYSSNTRGAPIDSSHAVYAAERGPVMQINYGLVNVSFKDGSHNTVTVNYHSTSEDANLLAEILRPLQSTAWHPHTAPLASLGIQQLQKRYLESLQKDNEIKEALAMYVAPECTLIINTKERFSLEEKVRDFLASEEKKVLLLLGVAGSGKSTFNRYLARSLWEAYDKEANKSGQTPIPLFIPLSSLKEPNNNLISEYLKKEKFAEDQIADLKANYCFIFILDGYDEIKDRARLFYVENELDEWQAKVIVTSRPEYLGDRYERQFHPKGQAYLLQTYQLAPFSDLTIEEYVNKYESSYPELEKSVAEHRGILDRPEVKDLIRNPFLLKLSLSELPTLAEKYKDSSQRITRLALYDQFVESWFERSQDRLRSIRLTDKEREAFDFLNKDFTKYGADFGKDLAVAMYQAGVVRVAYSPPLSWKKQSVQDWREDFFNNKNIETKLLRFNAPLICRDDQYEFIHKSVQDYFVARALWEEMRELTEIGQLDLSNELSIVRNLRPLLEGLGDLVKLEPSALFNQLNVVEDPAVLSFLAERVRQERTLIKPLLGWVKASKTRYGVERAAANALTILVKAGVQLSRLDLSQIKVRGANLNYGVFDQTKFERADLSEVKLRGAWLRGANFKGANLKEVNFGELPSLEVGKKVMDCCYSPDGRWLAVGTNDGEIQLYKTETLKRVDKISAHNNQPVYSVKFSRDNKYLASGSGDGLVKLWEVKNGKLAQRSDHHEFEASCARGVWCVSFSPDGILASGGGDKVVRLWEVESGKLLDSPLEGHSEGVKSVNFSVDGTVLVSGSDDNTVMLWMRQSGDALHTPEGNSKWVLVDTLEKHNGWVESVTFSPDGRFLASGSADRTVRLWGVERNGKNLSTSELHTLNGHTNVVKSVSFSPNSEILASGSFDYTVKLWKAESGEPLYTFEGHTSLVNSVSFSLNGDLLASGSVDETVRLWRVESRQELHALEGHRGNVNSVSFSPKGEFLASGSDDKTIKLWSVKSGEMLHTLEGHSGGVNSVSFSPKDDGMLASGGHDNTVNLWNVNSGEKLRTLGEHTASVWSVSFSPDGKFLASGGNDNTVKLWNVTSENAFLYTLTGHSEWVSSVSFSPDGKFLASGGRDFKVKLWKKGEGWEKEESREAERMPKEKEEQHSKEVNSVNFSPDSTVLASGSNDRTVRLWKNVTSEKVSVSQLAGHSDRVMSVNFSPNSKFLASGSYDRTVKLWSIDTEQCKRTLADCVGKIASIDWQEFPKGDFKMAGSEGSAVHIWQIKCKGNDWTVELDWTSSQNELVVAGMSIQDAKGLSSLNTHLLKQRDAQGEPAQAPEMHF